MPTSVLPAENSENLAQSLGSASAASSASQRGGCQSLPLWKSPPLFYFSANISRTHPRPRRNLPRTSSTLFEPFMECAELYRVLDGCVSGQDPNREILADILDPTALANRTEQTRTPC
jgi:hypothetical protein